MDSGTEQERPQYVNFWDLLGVGAIRARKLPPEARGVFTTYRLVFARSDTGEQTVIDLEPGQEMTLLNNVILSLQAGGFEPAKMVAAFLDERLPKADPDRRD